MLNDLTRSLQSQLTDKTINFSRNGAIRLGPLPEVGKHAFLHVLFPPLPISDIASAAHAAGINFPANYTQFLHHLNGAILFKGGLSIYGIRGDISRDPDIRKPFDVIEANTLIKPFGGSEDSFYIGSFDLDGAHIVMKGNAPGVVRCDPNTHDEVARWNSIQEMLISEIERLAADYSRSKVKHQDTH